MDQEYTRIKIRLYETCLAAVQLRIDNAQQAMKAAQESRDNETKSSAGDKFETGRAMMQSAQERNKIQLIGAMQLKQQLQKIKVQQVCTQVKSGCLIQTNKGCFFMAIGLGKIKLEDQTYFVISEEAPIARAFANKKAGDTVDFQNQQYIIQHIA